MTLNRPETNISTCKLMIKSYFQRKSVRHNKQSLHYYMKDKKYIYCIYRYNQTLYNKTEQGKKNVITNITNGEYIIRQIKITPKMKNINN